MLEALPEGRRFILAVTLGRSMLKPPGCLNGSVKLEHPLIFYNLVPIVVPENV